MPVRSKVSTKEMDKGYKKFTEQVERMKEEPFIKVGILAEEADKVKTKDINLAGIAAVNEFGTTDGRVPARSFIRSTMDEKKQYFVNLTKRALTQILFGADIVKSMNIIGLGISKEIQKKITDIRTPPNAPSTVRRKGSSNPLIDTGRMRASIRHKVVFSDEEG